MLIGCNVNYTQVFQVQQGDGKMKWSRNGRNLKDLTGLWILRESQKEIINYKQA